MEKDVCQVLRYMKDVKDLMWMHGNMYALYNQYLTYRDGLDDKSRKVCDDKFVFLEKVNIDQIDEKFIKPVLIGPRVSTENTENIISALSAVGGYVFHYTEPTTGFYEFYEATGEVSIFNQEYTVGTLDWMSMFLKLVQSNDNAGSDLYIDFLPWLNFHEGVKKGNRGD